MTILSLLKSNSRRDMVQAVRELEQTGSPYGMKVLRQMYSEERDAKAKEFIKKAMFSLKKSIASDFRKKQDNPKATPDDAELTRQVDAMMALAYMASIQLNQQLAENMIVNAYSLRPERFTIREYRELIGGVFTIPDSAIDTQMTEYLKKKVRRDKARNKKYGCLSYLLDLPVAIVVFTIFSATFSLRIMRGMLAFYESATPPVQFGIMAVTTFLVAWTAIRLWVIILERAMWKRQFGWQKRIKKITLTELNTETASVLGI